MTAKPVRILVVDDYVVVRHGLKALLEIQPGLEICGEAANGREAIAAVRALKPDLVLMDISMPELNGLEATRIIRKEFPSTEVLILTMHSSEEVAREVLRAGARGYVLKSDSEAELVAAINALRLHKAFLSPRVAEFVLDGYIDGERRDGEPRSRLTPRENQIVQMLAEGKSNKEVAATVGISTRTVETHRAHIMRKLRLNSLSELVRYAIREKIVEP